MLFKSPHAAMTFNIRPSIPTRNAMGEIISERPAIRAEFGQFGAEQPVVNPLTGQTDMHAEIIGHFFDTDLWYEQRLESRPVQDEAEVERCQEEKEYLELVLQRKCREVPSLIQQVERVAVPASVPWANYDAQTAEQVVDAAQLLELVPEAVRYERENQRRPDVLSVLEPILEGLSPDRAAKAKPDEAYPDDAFHVEKGAGVTVGAPQPRTAGGIMQGGMGGSVPSTGITIT